MPDTAQLYDRDWYAWTQDQATRLRAWPEHLRPNGLDVEHLAEEVEDLGKSDRRAVESFLHQVVLHLLKLEFHTAAEARLHWMAEVDAFRLELERRFEDSPSLRAQRAALAGRAWTSAERALRRQLAREAPEAARRLEATLRDAPGPRYALDEQLLNADWYPSPACD
ncbi:MAG: DUF29 domain-containing protein [Acetobacteraceae bacterium]|nr:DUF29 domain-containing protein [Acetobacteraceae bacterium]